jgi:hypothetical protein
VICVPLFVLNTSVIGRLALDPTQAGVLLCLSCIVLVPIPIMWIRVGSPIAYWVALRWARRIGGQRVNSHPRLVLAMRTLGPMVFLTCVAAVFALRHPIQEYRTLAVLSLFVTAWGWERPWDLLVVEPDDDARR